jgi:hypothetical protein
MAEPAANSNRSPVSDARGRRLIQQTSSALDSVVAVEIRCFLVSLRGGVSTRVVGDGQARAASSIGGRTCCGQRRLRRRGFSFIL